MGGERQLDNEKSKVNDPIRGFGICGGLSAAWRALSVASLGFCSTKFLPL